MIGHSLSNFKHGMVNDIRHFLYIIQRDTLQTDGERSVSHTPLKSYSQNKTANLSLGSLRMKALRLRGISLTYPHIGA